MKKIWSPGVWLTVGVLILMNASAGAEIDWRQSEGTKIRLLMNRHPFTSYIQERLPEFEGRTGIRVTMEVLPEDQFRHKRLIELNAGGRVDGFMLMPGQVKWHYWKAGWLEPLDEYIEDPALTDADWDPQDFFPKPMAGSSIDGHYIGVVINAEASLLAYRKDLFELFHVTVPDTMEELEASAQFFHGKDIEGRQMVGITMRGKSAAATSQWADFLYSFGGSWLTEERRANIDSPAGIAALTCYGNLLRNYGPQGPSMLHWPESISLFMEGRAAMIFDGNVFKSFYENPEESNVAGKVGYTTIPAGPAGKVPHVSNWSLAISASSPPDRQKAAWLFIQWATNKKNALGALIAGVPSGRASAWNSPEYKAQDIHPDWTRATLTSIEIGQPDWNPPVLNVPEIRDIIGQSIVDAIEGKDVKKSVARCVKQMNKKMELN